jgi:cation:H+ antiporter
MPILWSLALFLVGFYILTKGANVLIRGASSLARLFGLSPWFIGMVIVGIGTSIPEFSINVASVFNGNTIGLATIIGSNTFNTLFVLGAAAVIAPLSFRREWILRDLPLNALTVLLAAAAILFPIFGDTSVAGVSRFEGTALVILLLIWIAFMLRHQHTPDEGIDPKVFSWATSLLFIAAGLVGVFFGGQWVIESASAIATFIGISPALVGFTVVAIGTSLPELVVSIVAATKKQYSIAIGNVIGSNIFDFLGIIGITALLRPITVAESLRFDIFATFGATLVLFLFTLLFGKRFHIGRTEGFFFIALYFAYFVFLFVRG